jgi:hypothetical protein
VGVREEARSQKPGARINVRIGKLVLDGFPGGDQYRIAEGVKRELARLIGEQGLGKLAGSQGKAAVLDAGSFAVEPGATGGVVGRRVAQSVHRGLAGGRGK